MVSSLMSTDSCTHRFGLHSLMSVLVLIPLLLTGMTTGTVFAFGSDVNGGGVEGSLYTAQVNKDSMGDLQPTSLPSPSPLTTSSVSPSPVQTPSDLFNAHTDVETQPSGAGSHNVVFDPANGGKAERVTVQDGSLASPPADNLRRDGYRFDGWSEHDRIMSFSSPITRDITLKARWTPVSDWVISPDHGPASADTSITITPPNAGFPSFSTLEAHDDKLIAVTSDGRLFTWTSNDEVPAHVPSPRNTSGEVRFTSGVVGGNGYAALSRDHRIYTWSKNGDTPALLDADSTTYTSIAATKDCLMAADQKGQVHIRASKGEPTGKVIRLPELALAVKMAGNDNRLLALDNKGQVWTWKPDANDINQIRPIRLTSRITQISAMDHGFVLLDLTGQISYLENEQAQPESLAVPGHSAITAINSDGTQAALVDSKGYVWVWKPGSEPVRADNGSQSYVQAASIGGRITAISRQGDLYGWSLDEYGQPSQPARIDTTQAPTLESASMEGQSLKLSKVDNAWQAEILARKPGPTAILITGRQDDKPFTRSLQYTVDRTLTRDAEPNPAHTVTFNADSGNPEPGDQQVSTPYGRVKRPSPDPARKGYQFDGWFIGNMAYDFSKPVDKDLTLTAKWTPKSRNNTWKISPDKGSQLGGESTTITPPDSDSRGIRFNQVSGTKDFNGFSLAVGSDGNAYAWGLNHYGQLGDGTTTRWTIPVMVRKPDPKTYPDLPADFTYVQVSAGSSHSLAVGSDGYAYAWGYNNSGQLGNNTSSDSAVPVRVRDPASPTDASKGLKAIQVSAGGWHSLAVGSDGYAYAWGSNHYGQLGNNTSSDYVNPVPVRVRDPASPADASKGLKAIQVSAGGAHSLAVGSDGYAYAWGYNHYGQLGNNTSSDYDPNPAPVRVRDPASPADASKGLKAIQVSAGVWHSLAVVSDGYSYAWGRNDYGQLGNNSIPASSHSAVPVPVSFSLQPVIIGVTFDQSPVLGLTHDDGNSVSVTTPAHVPGTATVSIKYTIGGAGSTLTDKSLTYTYTPLDVLPQAGGEGILLALATGMTGMGGVLASLRHRREQHNLLHASHE